MGEDLNRFYHLLRVVLTVPSGQHFADQGCFRCFEASFDLLKGFFGLAEFGFADD